MRAKLVVLALVVLGAAASARAEIVLRMGTVAPDGSRYMKDLRLLGQEIERMSGGALRLKWLSSGRLGDEKAMAELLKTGSAQLDGAGLTGIGLSHLVPEMRLWSFPGLFQRIEEVDFLEGKFREEHGAHFEKQGLVRLAWTDVGFAYIYSNHAIASLDDLRKHTMWVWRDDTGGIEAAKLLGLKVKPQSLRELTDGLRAGTIDTWLFPPLAAVGFGVSGYAKHMTEFPWHFLVGALVLRKDVHDALPADLRRVLSAVSRKWDPRLVKSWRAENEKALAAMKKQGMKVVRATPAAREGFFQAAAEHRHRYAKLWNLEALMRKFSDSLHEFRGKR